MNKIKTLVITTVAAVGITVVGTGIIHAAQTTNGRTDYMSSLVSAIAQKFNLSQSDVQKVFDEQKQVMQTQMQTDRVAQQKNVLDQDVKNGKITQTQEDAIIAKQKEVQTFMDSLKDKSQTDRESAMKTETTSLQQWAKDNSIDEHYVMLGRGGRGPGMGQPGQDVPPPTDNATTN